MRNSFLGTVDEVSIYSRVLSAAEVQSIYAAGHQGKCKHSCHVPWDSHFCLSDQSVNVTAYICNSTTQPPVLDSGTASDGSRLDVRGSDGTVDVPVDDLATDRNLPGTDAADTGIPPRA